MGLCRLFIDAYATAIVSGKARWIERDTAEGLVGDLLAGLKDRTRPEFLDPAHSAQRAAPIHSLRRQACVAGIGRTRSQVTRRLCRDRDIASRGTG
ncbi:MAG TPA: hypothetical protein VFP68_06945, partial [Burkholderiaceae bacterium]|nr:hypothetical protein [Burkholderiaceae bacterium]